MLAHPDGLVPLPLGFAPQGAAAQAPARQAQGKGFGLLGRHFGDQQGAQLLHQGRGGGVWAQAQGPVGREHPLLAVWAPAMSARQLDLAAVGLDPSEHPPLFIAQGPAAVRTLFLHRVGLVLHGLLDQQTLQAQGGLANVLFDKAQALFGVLLHLRQALAQVFAPLSEVLFQHALFTLGDDFIDQFFEPGGGGTGQGRTILGQINKQGHREN